MVMENSETTWNSLLSFKDYGAMAGDTMLRFGTPVAVFLVDVDSSDSTITSQRIDTQGNVTPPLFFFTTFTI